MTKTIEAPPIYNAPAPAYVQPAVPAYEAPAGPAPEIFGAPDAAKESVQDAPAPSATPSNVASPSVTAEAELSNEPTTVPAAEVQSLNAEAASTSADAATPVIVAAASVVVVGVAASAVFFHFGPGVSGIRRIARALLRR